MSSKKSNDHLGRYLSPLGAWAFSFGCSVGWGAFVMPGDTFLPIAGPVGSLLGFFIGGLLMLVLAANYHYMVRKFPESGGAYCFASRAFGSDHGFLAGWFLALAYIVVFWGNAMALPMIARYLLGDTFQKGFHYVLFGYDVYLGEILLSILAMVAAALICLRPRLSALLQILFALLLAGGVMVCFLFVLFGPGGATLSFHPAFAPGIRPVSGVFSIVSLAPWAFVGFEAISHSAGEFRFSYKKTFQIMALSLTSALLSYALVTLLSLVRLPGVWTGWVGNLRNLERLTGLEALPAFACVRAVMGRAGVALLSLSALGAILTGLIGFITASSRLLYSISLDGMLPRLLGGVNERGVPYVAILSILLLSLPVPFLGRTAINWLIDVTTICVIIAYTYVSASALTYARREENLAAEMLGGLGLIISCAFAVVFLVPNLLLIRTLCAESYLLIAFWSTLGLLWFRYRYIQRTDWRSGPTTMVWTVFLALIMYTSMLWVLQTASQVEVNTAENIEAYYREESAVLSQEAGESSDHYVREEMKSANRILRNSSIIQICFIVAAMLIVFSIYDLMQKRAKQTELEKKRAEESSRSKSVFLSNMSHDIRTPMNAIVGMTAIATEHIDDKERVQDCLKKISISSRQLLGLINDVLDISKIESGKMTLNLESLSLRVAMENLCVIFYPQARDKGERFEIYVGDILKEQVYCDSVRLNQVLLNFLSNALKFTPQGGEILVHLW